jgi:ABC-type transporter Mla subunit MlaD
VTDSERLVRIEHDQTEMMATMGDILGTLETHTELLTKISDTQDALKAWLEEPPSSDLGDTLRALTAAFDTLQDLVLALPAAVARAVKDGEVR